jgi:hypothetical protein
MQPEVWLSGCAAGSSHLDPGARQHRVERLGELPGTVPDQEPEPVGLLPQVHQQVPRLLYRPGAVRVRSHSQDMHMAGADLDHEEHSVESGLSLLSVFVLPRTDDRQMTLSLGQTQSSNEEEVGARKRSVCPLSEVAGSRSVA